MNSIFNVNWNRFVLFFLPKSLQNNLLVTLVNSFILPLKTNYKAFLNFKREAEYKVKHNGQTVYLQKMLNDQFDPYLRRIKVENITPKQPFWVFYQEESKAFFVYNIEDSISLFIYNAQDYYNEFDFKVIIPTVLLVSQSQMQAQINYYKLFSKNYEIIAA